MHVLYLQPLADDVPAHHVPVTFVLPHLLFKVVKSPAKPSRPMWPIENEAKGLLYIYIRKSIKVPMTGHLYHDQLIYPSVKILIRIVIISLMLPTFFCQLKTPRILFLPTASPGKGSIFFRIISFKILIMPYWYFVFIKLIKNNNFDGLFL